MNISWCVLSLSLSLSTLTHSLLLLLPVLLLVVLLLVVLRFVKPRRMWFSWCRFRLSSLCSLRSSRLS